MNSNTNCISHSKYGILLKYVYDSQWAILIHSQYYCVPLKNILYTSQISARILRMSESSPGCSLRRVTFAGNMLVLQPYLSVSGKANM